MDAQQLISDFMASDHGNQAMQALAAQGINADDAQQMLSKAMQTANDHVEQQNAGIMGDHPGTSFFSAFAAGLVRGDGFFQSLLDGGEGILTGRVAEALANDLGVDPAVASAVAAAATPYVIGFLKEKLA